MPFANAQVELYNRPTLQSILPPSLRLKSARGFSLFSFLETLFLKNASIRQTAALLICAYPVLDFALYASKVPRQRLIDLFVQYVAARVLAVHGNIYSFAELRAMANHIGGVRYGSAFSNLLLAYTHPPSDTFFDLRWTPFGFPDVKLIYSFVTPLLYLTSLVLIVWTLKPMAARGLHWIFPVLLFALFLPTRASLGLGQSDITIFFPMVVAFWAFSRDHDLVGGIALGVAILTKIAPAVFLVYWLWKREWRVLIYALATSILIILISLPFVGIDLWIRFVTQIFPALSTGTAYAQNQSLPGLINRLMLEPRFAAGLQSAPNVPAIRAVSTAAELILVGLAMLVTGGRRGSRNSLRFALEFSVWLIVLLIISPIAWDHYFTWLLLPITVLLSSLLNSQLTIARGAILFSALVVGLWLVNTPVATFFNYPEAWQKSPLLYGSLIILALLFERIQGLGPVRLANQEAPPSFQVTQLEAGR